MTLGIVIPSFRRMAKQATLGNLPRHWCERTTLVLDESDASLQRLYDLRGARVVVHPADVDTIAKKRAWIIRNWQLVSASPRIVMFDDDLRFAIRKLKGETKLTQATNDELDYYLQRLDWDLGCSAHCGWSMRQGNNTVKDGGWIFNARMCYVLGYDCETILRLEADKEIELGRVRFREDMDLTLQLLRLGYENTVCYDVAADQVSGFAAKGGCSEERTMEQSNAEAHRLAELHPGLVKVVDKKYEGSVPRQEVVVQWKKAIEQGREYRRQKQTVTIRGEQIL